MKHLAKTYDVTLAAISFGKNPEQKDIKPLNDIGVTVHTVALPAIKSGLRSALTMYDKYPLEISFYLRKDFKELVDSLCIENNFDIGISFFLRTAEYLKHKNFKKILISEDCRVLYQTRSYQSSMNLPQRAIRMWEVWKLKTYEPDIMNYFDTITLVTNDDIEAMKIRNPDARYRLVTNGVQTDIFSPPNENIVRKDILFTGKLSVWSNTLMVHKIVKDIMPVVFQKFPDIKLHLVGSNPLKSILALESDRIQIHANVPDISEYYKKCKIFLHPHSAATGIQNKLLEAMAAGLASVTTLTGIQGIDGKHREHFMIGGTKQEMIENTIELLSNDELCDSISRNSRQLILDTHTWEVVNKQIDSVIEEMYNE